MRGLDLDFTQRAEQRIGPAQLLLAELVSLPVAGLSGRLESELVANPALDLPQRPSCGGCGLPLWRATCIPCRNSRRNTHDHQAFLGSMPARSSARLRVLSECAASLAPGDRWIAEYLLADVDDHGLLADPPPVVAARLGCPVDRLARVIEGLRRGGMPGLCARTLPERLALQVAAAGSPVPDEVKRLLHHGLDALPAGRQAAAEASGLADERVASALAWLQAHIAADIIERDEPGGRPQTVDVVVRQAERGLVAEAVAGPWSAVRVAPLYLEHAADPRLRPDVVRAERFVEALARRESVLTRVCAAVVEQQAARVISGPGAERRALTRRDVAAELGVHESTVSRAVSGKHLLLPRGEVVALAVLFGGSGTVRQCLREIVAGESVPHSDTELARALAGRGHVVARRTIAKYRAELGIPHQRHRGGGQRDADPEPAHR